LLIEALNRFETYLFKLLLELLLPIIMVLMKSHWNHQEGIILPLMKKVDKQANLDEDAQGLDNLKTYGPSVTEDLVSFQESHAKSK